MFKSVYKNIFKLLYCFVMFFSCVGIVKANFFDQKGGNDIYVNCNTNDADNKCIPLCVYQNSNGEDVGMIGYYYGDNSKWEVAFRGKQKYSFYNIYFNISGSLFHGDDIYDGSGSDRADWINFGLYDKLDKEFSCPARMYIDESNVPYNELCFEDRGGNCSNLNNGGTKFKNASTNSYSFMTEYSYVMPAAYESLRDKFSDDGEEINKEKVKFLSTLDSGYKYDASISSKENAINNCVYLKEKADGKYQEYMKTFASDDIFNKYLNNYLNPTIHDVAVSKNVRNADIYNYITLSRMMKNKRTVIYEGGNSEDRIAPIIDMFSAAFNKNVKQSINFISNYCIDEANYNIDMRVDTDGDGIIDSDDMNMIIDSERESFDIRVFAQPKIAGLEDPDSFSYDCSFLTDVADIISTAYFILEMVGLAILVVFTSMDYVKIFLNDNADELKKANSNFLKRLIIAVILFLLPALVNFALRLFKIEGINSEHPLCVQISNK